LSELWVVNASPIICLAKAGYLQLLDQLGASILIPEAVVREIEVGPAGDPARKALESGWGTRASPARIPESVLEWGLGAGETAVLALALERPNGMALVDDGAARRCARTLGVKSSAPWPSFCGPSRQV
jgi:predicted nucleic acid-binding protein